MLDERVNLFVYFGDDHLNRLSLSPAGWCKFRETIEIAAPSHPRLWLATDDNIEQRKYETLTLVTSHDGALRAQQYFCRLHCRRQCSARGLKLLFAVPKVACGTDRMSCTVFRVMMR